jgi:hypothetical protein
MKKFLIQVEENGIPSYDFCHQMLIAKRFIDWRFSLNTEFQFIPVTGIHDILDDPDSYIPIGSIEFVENFVRTNYGEAGLQAITPVYPTQFANPLNYRYLGGMGLYDKNSPYTIAQCMGKAPNRAFHLKNAKKLKHELNGEYNATNILKNREAFDKLGEWYMGGCVYPLTEWRVFVFNGTILDIKNYKGDPWIMPNKEVVEKMVKEYYDGGGNARAFTLDVGVDENDNSTKIVEFHEFYSCGLYGFDMYDKLPYMFSQQWALVLQRIKSYL